MLPSIRLVGGSSVRCSEPATAEASPGQRPSPNLYALLHTFNALLPANRRVPTVAQCTASRWTSGWRPGWSRRRPRPASAQRSNACTSALWRGFRPGGPSPGRRRRCMRRCAPPLALNRKMRSHACKSDVFKSCFVVLQFNWISVRICSGGGGASTGAPAGMRVRPCIAAMHTRPCTFGLIFPPGLRQARSPSCTRAMSAGCKPRLRPMAANNGCEHGCKPWMAATLDAQAAERTQQAMQQAPLLEAGGGLAGELEAPHHSPTPHPPPPATVMRRPRSACSRRCSRPRC
jgi:hypothetical protein